MASIPDHTLLRPIGRGAYGEVWLARNIMGTPRAVKIIWRRQFESDRPYDREFAGIQGYEPVSRTSAGLMQVLHVGRNDIEGYFYYVMELADDAGWWSAGESESTGIGQTLGAQGSYSPRTLRSEMERRGRLPVGECLSLALDLVAGLACLHRNGLVHRDVKPGNIIFVNGRAKLADIGLVSVHNEARTFVGTEGYIPPEGPGSPAADLYALGMVLYEAATGQPPDRFPQTPLDWFAEKGGGERLEFHEIALKAGEGSRERRYQNAGEMQADLALLQSGQSLRRVRALQRRANLSRRLILAMVAAVVIAVGSVLLGNYRVRVEAEQRAREQTWREEAEQARANAERAERQAREQLLTALVEQARADVRSGELGQRVRTLDAVRRAAAITNSPDLRQTAVAAFVLPDLRFEREIPLAIDVTAVALDPAFNRLAIGRGTNAFEIRSVTHGSIVATIPSSVDQLAQRADWSPDGQYVAVTRAAKPFAWQANVEVWHVASLRRVLTLPPTRYGACSFHPRRPLMLGGHLEDTVGIWDLTDGREISRHAVTGQVHHVKFSPDGESFVVQHRIGKAWFTDLFKASDGAVLKSTPSGWVDAIAWHPQDKFVALAARQGEVYLHDRTTGETTVLGRHKNEASTAVFSPDGAFLFTGGEEQEIICWDLGTRRRAFGFAARGAQMQFAGHGARCAILTRSGLMLHELIRPAACRDLPASLGATVRHAAFSPNGRWLAAGGLTGLGVWDVTGETPPAVIAVSEHATPFFSPDSSELLAYNIERLIRWRVEGATNAPPQLRALSAPETGRILSAQFAENSLFISVDGRLLIYSSLDESRHQSFNIGSVYTSVSPDGKWVTLNRGDTLGVYTRHPWLFHKSVDLDAKTLDHVFAPGGDELAIATASSLTIVRTNDWKPQRRLTLALDRRARILFMPDGRSFWLSHDARTSALYDTRSLAPLLPLAPGVMPLAVSPDGDHVLVSIDSHRLQLWKWKMIRRELEGLGVGWTEDYRSRLTQ
jgi:WD40 repeat protein